MTVTVLSMPDTPTFLMITVDNSVVLKAPGRPLLHITDINVVDRRDSSGTGRTVTPSSAMCRTVTPRVSACTPLYHLGQGMYGSSGTDGVVYPGGWRGVHTREEDTHHGRRSTMRLIVRLS